MRDGMQGHVVRIRKLALLVVCLLLLLAAACEGGGGESVKDGGFEGEQQKGDSAQGAGGSAGDGGAADASEPRAGRVIKIGFSMDTLQEERWRKDRDLFKAAVEKLGAEIEVMEANGDDALQIMQAEQLIGMGVDLLVVVPHNAETIATIVGKAHAMGVKVVAYDRIVKNADIDLYVSFDNEQVGELQARAITKLVPKGKYVYIGGSETDNNAHLFKKGVFNVLQPYIDCGDITVVFDQWTKDWTPANARLNMEAALKANGTKIDAVIAANDGTAGGVIEALTAAGLAGLIPVAGQDAELAAVQRIVEGTQVMTVYKPIQALSDRAAELAVKLARGEAIVADHKINNGKIEVPSVLLSPIAVDRHNLEQTIIADGFHAAEDVFRSTSTAQANE